MNGMNGDGSLDRGLLDAHFNRACADRPGDQIRLNEVEVYGLLDLLGIETCSHAYLRVGATQEDRQAWLKDTRALAVGTGRVVMKIVGRGILHKSDVGGVRILAIADLSDAEILTAAEAVLDEVGARVPGGSVEGVVACAFVIHAANRPGQELLLSLRQDSAFGPVVVVGVGGVLTEWYGRATGGRSRLIFPAAHLDRDMIARILLRDPVLSLMVEKSRLYESAPLPVETLVTTIMKLGALAVAYAAGADREWTLEEVEINPAVISGGVPVAIDGVGLISRRTSTQTGRPLQKIHNLLEPKSALVMGVSAKGANPGRIIMNNLRKSPGIDADGLHIVHPRQSEIDGLACVPDLESVPRKVDLAVVCVPAEGARDAIAEIVRLDKAESIILIPGGFAESGQSALAAEIVESLEAGHRGPGGGPVMVGGNCLGIVSRGQYNTFFLPDYKLPFSPAEQGGNLAIVSQSGAYLVTFASNYDGVINPRASISYGNQMDLTVSDFLEYFLGVDDVDVIACYIEGFATGDGERFLKLAARARDAGKQVIVFKAGKTPLGAKAAASHTASLAGDYDIAKFCLQHVGVIVCETLNQFEDYLKIFTLFGKRPARGPRVGVISNAGFECSTVTDGLRNLQLATFDAEVKRVLDAQLPAFAHRDNPVDATPMAGTEAYALSTEAIVGSPNVDCAIISSVPVTQALDNLPPGPGHREDITAASSQPARFIEILTASDKPVVVVVDSGALYDPMAVMIEAAGIPVFRKIDRAARALSVFIGPR